MPEDRPMIIDSHTHAWESYERPMLDHGSRGRVEQLLFHMDREGVDRAVLVCARVYGNDRNNDYGRDCALRYPDRIVQFADVDSSWSDTYHTPGAAGRLADAAERYALRGFTHYLKNDPEWLASEEGLAFFETAARLGLVASLAFGPGWMPALSALAARFPSVVFLCHHMAGATPREPEPRPLLRAILAAAARPNIHIKLSGFHYHSGVAWDYPYADTHEVVRALYEHFGPGRLCWGSDYPEVRTMMTYRQALEAVRSHLSFIPEPAMALVLGENMRRLLRL